MLDSSKLLRDKIKDSAYKNSSTKRKYAAAASKIKVNGESYEQRLSRNALPGGLPSVPPIFYPPKYSILTGVYGGSSAPTNANVNLSVIYAPNYWDGVSSGNYISNPNVNYTITFAVPSPYRTFFGGENYPGLDTFSNLQPAQCNGVWNLWIQDFAGGDQGGISLVILRMYLSSGILSFTSNQQNIIIPNSGVASPYPVTFTVSGVTEICNWIEISIVNYNHTYAGDVGMLLTSPPAVIN